MRDEWEREVRKELRSIASAMTESLGIRVKCQLDTSRLMADQAIPEWVLPQRLEHFAPSTSVSMAPSQERKAIGARASLIARVRELWHKHRDCRPELWSYIVWAQDQQEKAPDTRPLSSADFAARMRTKRDLKRIKETTEAPDFGPDRGGDSD